MSFIGKLKIGTQVLVTNTPKFVDKKATVMFVGKLPGGGKNQQFIGVELETPDGTHSGQFEGKEYFKAKQNHGMFAKPKAVKLSDGTPLSSLLTATTTGATTTTKTATTKTTATTQQRAGTTTTKAPISSKKQPQTKPAIDQNKLSDQLKQLQLNQEIQTLKQELEQSKKKIESLESTDTQQQLSAMRQRIRELQDQNRMLKVQQQKAKLQTSQNSQQKTKQLQQKIDFFNNQKQFHQKEKAQLKKKILRLEEELDSYEGNLEEFEKLTFKVENLQAKNAKLREQLEQAKTENRNNQMLTGKAGKQSTGEESKVEELQENIKILNETITLLEGDLNEEKQKSLGLQKQLQNLQAKGGDVTKLEKKLKSRDEQLQALKAQLQASADAATFAEKLTLDLLRKQQQLKESTSKLSQYLNQIQGLELQVSESKQMIDLQTAQLESQQQQIQKHLNEKQQQQLHIAELNKQIAKYKSKISQLAQNNESLLMTNSQIMDQTVDENDLMRQFVSGDVYQHRYFETLKTVQQLSQKYFELELQSSRIKNIVGVQMLNLVQTIPQGYTQQFYPQIVKIIIDLKSVNDKLYLLFDAASTYFRTRGDIYSRDNLQKAKWLIMLMQQMPLLYGQLTKIQLSITTAQTEQQITDIVSNIAIKDMLRKIDYHASQLLHRFAADNIDPSIDLSPFIEPVETLDNICAQGRKLEYEHQTRAKLCVQTMVGAQKIFAVILIMKEESQLKENAQVDSMIESFLKMLLQYLKQCCNNPQLRVRTETKGYLSGLQFIINLLEQLQINDNVNELSSLYSQVEEIKMLKETLMTTQYHLKQLISDLGEIVYTNQLSRIKCNLPGKVWVERGANINKQLNRVQQLLTQKQQLSTNLHQAKKKIIILQKQIKDRQATKQLYQKRIGQLQLKVQQSSTYEVENKRYQQKIRSYEDTNKLIQDQLQSQVSKRKELEQEVRRVKEKLHALQTQGAGKGKQKKITTLASSSSNEQLTSLGLFKNVLKQCDFLKTVELKKKILQIKQSPLIAKLNEPSEKQIANNDSQSKTLTQSIRRKAIDAMCEMKIIDPRVKDHKEKSALVNSNLVLKSLQMQVEKQNFSNPPNQDQKVKQEIVEMKIGSFMLKNRSSHQLNAKLNVVGNFKILSF